MHPIGAVVKKHLEARKIECKDAAKKTTDECISYNSIPTDFDTVIAINAKEEAPDKKDAGSTKMCSVGICYRGSSPYTINLKFMGQDRTVMVQLPNNSPVMAMPLKWNLFVTTKHTVVLQDGMLQKYDSNKPSSALAMVSWPLSVADEVITTTSKIVQMKIDTSKHSVELEQQLLAAQQERKKIQDDLDKLNQPKAEGYGLVVNSSKSLLTAQVGKPKPIIPSSPQVSQSNPQIQQPVANGVSPSNDGTLVKKP